MRNRLSKWLGRTFLIASLASLFLAGGCTTTGVLLSAAGVATDTSMTWDIVKHVHAKLTEGDDVPCIRLDSVQRALSPRCGPFIAGSVQVKDLRNSPLQSCVLGVAVRDPRLWPAIPELIEKGATPQACGQSPLLGLAQLPGCPDFSTASPEVLRAFQWLGESDVRALQHDVVRMFSCPSAVASGLDQVLVAWLAQGGFDAGVVAFGPLGALHPDYLGSRFARDLEARGHTAREGLGGYVGVQPRGFELALRNCQWAALEWWLARAPELANRVPPAQGNQLPWVPLARVLAPNFLANPAGQPDMVRFLMARGADPWKKLPYDASTSVVEYARAQRSPLLALLEPPVMSPGPTVVAGTLADLPGQ